MIGLETQCLSSSFCALLPDSPFLGAEAAWLGHEHQHGFTTLKTKMEEINRLGKAEEKAGTSGA